MDGMQKSTHPGDHSIFLAIVVGELQMQENSVYFAGTNAFIACRVFPQTKHDRHKNALNAFHPMDI